MDNVAQTRPVMRITGIKPIQWGEPYTSRVGAMLCRDGRSPAGLAYRLVQPGQGQRVRAFFGVEDLSAYADWDEAAAVCERDHEKRIFDTLTFT